MCWEEGGLLAACRFTRWGKSLGSLPFPSMSGLIHDGQSMGNESD